MTSKSKKYRSAKGMEGILLSFGGDISFRVYDKKDKEKFIDYQLAHNDLEITIEDDDAFIYDKGKGKDPVIDYGRRTLGIKK